MPALSFSVFREKILSGAKRQSIRAIRKNPIKSGDKLYLYWKQRSPKECEKLGETTCSKVSEILINQDGVNIKDKIIINQSGLDQFAIADGFDNWQAMIAFFDKTHGLPFTGNLIEWDFPLKEVTHADES